MRGFGQIAELCAFARPDVGVITNVGPVHLEQVGDLDGVVRAKGELIAALPAGRHRRSSRQGFPVERDDLEVVRVGERRHARVVRAAACSRTSLGARRGRLHRAASGAERADRARDGRRARPRPARTSSHVAFTAWRNQELPLPGGGVLSTTPGTRTPSRCAPRSSTSSQLAARPPDDRGARRHGRARRLRATRATARSAARSRELGDRRGRRDRRAGARLRRPLVRDPVDEALAAARASSLQPGDCVLVKGARVRSGSSASPRP